MFSLLLPKPWRRVQLCARGNFLVSIVIISPLSVSLCVVDVVFVVVVLMVVVVVVCIHVFVACVHV